MREIGEVVDEEALVRLQVKGKNVEVSGALRGAAQGTLAPAGEGPPAVTAEEPFTVKTKQSRVKPMTPEEAVLQLELIGHDFFVFKNVDSDDVNVVYRRRDGNYGLMEPQAA